MYFDLFPRGAPNFHPHSSTPLKGKSGNTVDLYNKQAWLDDRNRLVPTEVTDEALSSWLFLLFHLSGLFVCLSPLPWWDRVGVCP